MSHQIEIAYNCIGFFGFGSGVSLFKKQGAYCNACPLAQQCWELHKNRCRQYFPDVCAFVDSFVNKEDKTELMKFIDKNGGDAYMSVMMGNIEDSLSIQHGQTVKDRGPYTLKYPFE